MRLSTPLPTLVVSPFVSVLVIIKIEQFEEIFLTSQRLTSSAKAGSMTKDARFTKEEAESEAWPGARGGGGERE